MKTVFQAIKEMRELSKKGESFSMTFMSYNSTEQKSEGVIEVRRARLRARTRKEFHRENEMIEEYTDLDTLSQRRFYQPLLMAFNGEKVSLQSNFNDNEQ